MSGIYEIHVKDGYKGPANIRHINPGGLNPNIDIVNVEDTNSKWRDDDVFHLINVTAGFHMKISLLISSGILDGVTYSQFLIKKNRLI